MTTNAPTVECIGLQFGHLWRHLRAARQQNEEVLTLTNTIDAYLDDAIRCIRENRQGEAIHSLVMAKDSARQLREVESRDVSIESTLRNMLHLMESSIARLFRK